MVGTALIGKNVTRLADSCCLQALLQRGLVVADGGALGKSLAKFWQSRGDDLALNEGGCGRKTTVEVQRGNDGFKGICEERRLFASATAIFPATQSKMDAKVQRNGHGSKVCAADNRRTKTGQIPFACGGKAAEELLCHDKAQDGIPKKLQLLVVGGGCSEPIATQPWIFMEK